MPYLNEAQRKNLRLYSYHGGDLSYTYKYVLSPLAQFCVDTFIPLWMAPNLITLTGLFCTLSAAILTLIYNPTLGPDCPAFLSIYSGLAIFFYQTLDNMDGKQARRTGSSSPLGMLFDHGCDAINAGLAAFIMTSVFGIGWTPDILFTFVCGMLPFYWQTWEEFYIGAMILPVFNGNNNISLRILIRINVIVFL